MISHSDKCIFIHIPKVAGQSIETFFLRRNGLSWEQRAPLLLRPKMTLDPAAAPGRLAHLRAADYVNLRYVSEELYNSYFKFAFVRNPYSRIVSFYKYLGYENRCNFEYFTKVELKKLLENPDKGYFVFPQWTFLYIADISFSASECLVDYVGRFETLDNDFSYVLKQLGIPDQNLPYVNQSNEMPRSKGTKVKNILYRLMKWQFKRRRKIISWKNVYTPKAKDMVNQIYKKDFEIFGYSEFLDGI